MKRSLGDSLIISALFIVVISLPGFIGDLDLLTQRCIFIILDLLICLYLFNSLNRQGAFSRNNQAPNWKNLLVLSPIVLPLLMLIVLSLVTGLSMFVFVDFYDPLYSFLQSLELILTVLIDEMFFRIFFHRIIKTENRILRIVISAAIFALFDILLFLQGAALKAVLLKMVFSFLLGLVLGAVVEYGHCVYFCIGYHLFLRVIYGSYLEPFLLMGPSWTVLFNPIIIMLIAVIYLIVAYFVFFRKKDVYDVY